MIDFFGEFTFDNDFVGGGVAGFNLNVTPAASDEAAEDGEVAEEKEVDASEVVAGLAEGEEGQEGVVYNGTADNPAIEDISGASNITIEGVVVRKNSAGQTFFEIVLDAINSLTFKGAANLTLSNGLEFGTESNADVDFTMDNGSFTGGAFRKGGKFSFGRSGNRDALYDVVANGTEIAPTAPGTFVVDSDGDLETLVLTEDGSVTVSGDYQFDFTAPGTTAKEVYIKNAEGSFTITTNSGVTVLDLSDLEADGNSTINVASVGGATSVILPENETAIRIDGTTYTYANESGEAGFVLNTSGKVTSFVFAGNDDAITVPSGSSLTFLDEDGNTLDFGIAGSTRPYTITRNADDEYAVTINSSAVLSDGDTVLTFTTAKTLDNPVTVYFDDAGNILSVDGLSNLGTSDTMKVVESKTVTAPDEGLRIGTPDSDKYISVGPSGDFTYSNKTVEVTSGDTVYALPDATYGVEGSSTAAKITDSAGNTYTYTGGKFTFDADGVITAYTFTAKNDSISVPNNSDIDLYYLDTTTEFVPPTITDTTGYTVTLSDVSTATDPQFEISGLDEGSIFPATAPFVEAIVAEDADNVITVNLDGEITAIDNFTTAGILLATGEHSIAINGSQLNYSATNLLTAVADGNKLVSVSGLTEDDLILTGTDDAITFVFETDADGDGTFLVNGKLYTVDGDSDKIVSITGGGAVTGLDEDANLTVTSGPISVNGKEYSATKIDVANETGESVVGFTTKGGNLTSFLTEAAHPIVTKGTPLDTITDNLLGLPAYGDQVFTESDNEAMDQSSNANRAEVILDDDGTANVAFNNKGKNLALVTATAEGQKNIDLGDGGDAVIVRPGAGDSSDSLVSIVGGAGNDSVVVQSAVPVYFDMADGGADKLITYAAANGKITLDHYDETSGAGVAIHDPQIESVKDLSSAIDEGMLLFQDGRILSIDRDEAANGEDRITDIRVNNKNANHQTMVRLFGYKDNGDSYGDDDGQLVGFTGKDGGTLDASDIEEDLILVGNKDGKHTTGSALISGVGNDTVYAGGGDTVNAGAGSNQIRLTDDSTRQAATVVVGQGLNTITGLQTGFNGDVIDISAVSSLGTMEYADGVLTIADDSTKTTTTAAVSTDDADYIAQTFVNDGTVMKAAIAKDGGTINVNDSNIPNYFVAKEGAINFTDYTGDVNVDVDEDWVGTSVGGEKATLLSGFSSLMGGKGNTLFKGGEFNEVLVAGIGESSLYGAGGRNTLVGSSSADKYGSTEFFAPGIKNGAQNLITNFEFIENGGANTATFDNLNIGMSDNNDVIDVKANADGSVSLAVRGVESQAVEKVTIEGAAGKEFLVDRGTTSESVVQIAANEVTINNDYVDFYYASENNATVQIGNVNSAKVWLESPENNGDQQVEYVGDFAVIDARGSNAAVEMAGNNVSNTIIGGLGNASMWGGAGNANDVMYGGSAHNEFYYEVGNGNDTIMSANDGDIIHLGATLDQIDFNNTNISASGIEVTFNDGGKLNVNSGADVTFSFDDGTAVRANRQTNQFE